MEFLNITEEKDYIHISLKDEEEEFLEVPRELMRRLLKSRVESHNGIISDFYDVVIGEVDNKREVAVFMDGHFVRLHLRSRSRKLEMRFGFGEPELIFVGIFFNERAKFSETFYIESFWSDFLLPRRIGFIYDSGNPSFFIRDDPNDYSCRIMFHNVNSDGFGKKGPCQFRTYDEALQIFDRCAMKKIWEAILKSLSSPTIM